MNFQIVCVIKAFEVIFTDLSKSNIQKAKNAGFESYQVDLNYGLDVFTDKQFDGVILLDVIEHIVSAEFLLQETYRVLKHNGFLILSTPNFSFFKNRLRILFGKLSIDEGYHYRFFTKKVLYERLRNAQFRVERTAHSMPAFGYNFIFNKILKHPRRHIQIPELLASFFSNTLVVKAKKD